MKNVYRQILLAAALGILAPWLLFGAAWELAGPRQPEALETAPEEAPTLEAQTSIRIPVILSDGTRVSMELNTYLTGVLLQEIPSDFDPQAKQAQAVVARTYTLRTVQKGIKHDPGAVCTNSACCQAYISEEAYLSAGGSAEAVASAREAVTATDGYVLTYGGSLIDATYFSCSGGYTEDALAVWGSEVPYLHSVASPGEESAAHFTDTVSYSAEAFQNALGVRLNGAANTWFGEVSYTKGGGVELIQIGGTAYKGSTLRTLLGLRSTAFTVSATSDSVVITTRGFGHRVGMSQYGAEAMAVQGSSWQEILLHYYDGAKIDKLEDLG